MLCVQIAQNALPPTDALHTALPHLDRQAASLKFALWALKPFYVYGLRKFYERSLTILTVGSASLNPRRIMTA